MIYVTGDMHGFYDFMKIMIFAESDEGKNLTKDDYLIICGDFGLVWNWQKTGRTVSANPDDDKWETEELHQKSIIDAFPFTTLFVEGNHENYDRLDTYPVTEWNGGKVQKISDSIIHLMRGQVFEIEGKKIFTFGGARSTDRGPATGTQELDEGICWWPEELCSQEERDEAVRNLKAAGNEVDYIITHCASMSDAYKMCFMDMHEHTAFLQNIEEQIKYDTWFCGHYHLDEWYGRLRVLYNDIVPIDTPKPYYI